ncbi:MAG: GAF domain-containing protein [Bryobacteraceae bacterium]
MPQPSRERDRHLALMLEIARSLAGSGTMRQLLRGCTDALVKHLSVGLARIWTVDESNQTLELQAGSGVSTSIEGEFASIPIGQLLVGHVAATGRPHLTNDLLHDPFIGDVRWVEKFRMTAFAGHPLTANERVVGVLAVFAHTAMSAGTLDLLGAAGAAMAQAIVCKRSEEGLARQEAELRLIMDSLPAMVSYVDRNTIYRRVNNAYVNFRLAKKRSSERQLNKS